MALILDSDSMAYYLEWDERLPAKDYPVVKRRMQ